MIRRLAAKFVPDYQNVTDKKVREGYGVLAGILGVLCNLFLFAVKLTIGLLMGSIAILSDAFNNLSDMGSSVVAILGAKLSSRRPDREHPFGHGRMEYVASLIVSFIIMLMGVELLKGSIEKIFHPEAVTLRISLILILSLSILVKVWMFHYNRYLGKQIDSSVMRAAATDSLNDCIATGGVIVSTVVGSFLPFSIDGVVGAAVSLFILYGGFGLAKDVVSLLLGTPPSRETVQAISQMVLSGKGVIGIHDLIVHDYGPGRVIASVHAEVPDNANVVEIHEEIDALEQRVLHELGIVLVIHMDPVTVHCEKTDRIKEQLLAIIRELDPAYSLHDFRITDGENRINIIFDLVVPYDLEPAKIASVVEEIGRQAKLCDSRYRTVIKIDSDYTV